MFDSILRYLSFSLSDWVHHVVSCWMHGTALHRGRVFLPCMQVLRRLQPASGAADPVLLFLLSTLSTHNPPPLSQSTSSWLPFLFILFYYIHLFACPCLSTIPHTVKRLWVEEKRYINIMYYYYYYSAIIQSVLCTSIAVWFGSQQDRKRLYSLYVYTCQIKLILNHYYHCCCLSFCHTNE